MFHLRAIEPPRPASRDGPRQQLRWDRTGGVAARSAAAAAAPTGDLLPWVARRSPIASAAARSAPGNAHGGGSNSSDAETGGLVVVEGDATAGTTGGERERERRGWGRGGANSQAKPAGRDCHATQLEKWGIICAARSRQRAIGSSPRAHQRGCPCTRATLPKARRAEIVGKWGRWRCGWNRTGGGGLEGIKGERDGDGE